MRDMNLSNLYIFCSRILLIALAVVVAACNQPSSRVDTNESANASRTLTLATTRSELTFQENKQGSNGFEFQLLEKFAQKHDYELQVVVANNEQEVFQALSAGHADIALTASPISAARAEEFRQSQSYMEVTTQLIYRHGDGKPKTFEQLENKRIVVPNLEHYHEKYSFLKTQHPKMYWEFSDKTTNELLQDVNSGKIDYTLVNSNEYLKKRSLFTRTRVAFDLYYPEYIGLSIANTVSALTLDELDNFIDQSLFNGTIDNLQEQYFGHADDINPIGSLVFFRRVNNRLPHYADLIEQVADDYNMDWRLLAAISYQESHWNPTAKSPTGVRGMMMLTRETAEHVGIRNRLDTAQSLVGGAIYFNRMLRRLPKSIQSPDRTWFALASYNVGLGHVFDARKITEFHGGNPDRWADVQKHLPLLEKKDWYQYTKHGFARGKEPVSYVQNIRQFHELLEWRFPSKASSESHLQITVKEFEDVLKEAKAEKQSDKNPELSSALFIFNGTL